MNLLDSLLDAIIRLNGDALVMHVGEKPYVVTTSEAANEFRGPLAWGQVELSSRVLTTDAVSGMLSQILPLDQRSALEAFGATDYEVTAAKDPGEQFTIVAARGGDDIWLEVRRLSKAIPEPLVAVAASSAAAARMGSDAVAVAAPPEVSTAQPHEAPRAVATAQPAAAETTPVHHAAVAVHETVPMNDTVDSSYTEAEEGIDLDAEESLDVEPDLTAALLGDSQDWAGEVMTEGDLGELLRASAAAVITGEPAHAESPDDLFAHASGSTVDSQNARFEVPDELAQAFSPSPVQEAVRVVEESAPVAAEESVPAVVAPVPTVEEPPVAIAHHGDAVSHTPVADAAVEDLPGEAAIEAAPIEEGAIEEVAIDVEAEAERFALTPPVEAAAPAPEPEVVEDVEPVQAAPAATLHFEEPLVSVAEPEIPQVELVDTIEPADSDSLAASDMMSATPETLDQPAPERIDAPATGAAAPEPFGLHLEESGSLDVPDSLMERWAADAMAETFTPALAEELVPLPPDEPAVLAGQHLEDAEPAPIAAASEPDDEEPVAEAAPPRTSAVVVPMARQPRTETSVDVRGGAGTTLQRLLRLAAARGAAAVYVIAQTTPMVRIDGEFSALDGEPALSAALVERLVADVTPPAREQGQRPAEWLIDVPEIGRVRCLTFRDHRGPGVIFRIVPPRAIAADQLGLSAEVQALCTEADGLVLVTGARGSGKSTLLSSFVDLINRTRSDHIITTESQIEFVHENKRALISQREVRGDGDTVAASVRAACREEPDVLIIEDIRTPELVSLALEAAESGRLVFASVPGLSTVSAIERLIEMFPAERREKIQASLAGSLRGVVSQVLLRKLKGGRVAAREVLLNTPAVAHLILEGKTFQLPAAIENGRRMGMSSFAESLAALVREGTVHPSHAYRKAPNREQFLSILRRDGVDTSVAERLA